MKKLLKEVNPVHLKCNLAMELVLLLASAGCLIARYVVKKNFLSDYQYFGSLSLGTFTMIICFATVLWLCIGLLITERILTENRLEKCIMHKNIIITVFIALSVIFIAGSTAYAYNDAKCITALGDNDIYFCDSIGKNDFYSYNDAEFYLIEGYYDADNNYNSSDENKVILLAVNNEYERVMFSDSSENNKNLSLEILLNTINKHSKITQSYKDIEEFYKSKGIPY